MYMYILPDTATHRFSGDVDDDVDGEFWTATQFSNCSCSGTSSGDTATSPTSTTPTTFSAPGTATVPALKETRLASLRLYFTMQKGAPLTQVSPLTIWVYAP